MQYYLVAAQIPPARTWRWETTWMATLEETTSFLVIYRCPAPVHLWEFSAASTEEMETVLARAHRGDLFGSWTAEQFLREQPLEAVERAWLAAAGEQPEDVLSRPAATAGRGPSLV